MPQRFLDSSHIEYQALLQKRALLQKQTDQAVSSRRSDADHSRKVERQFRDQIKNTARALVGHNVSSETSLERRMEDENLDLERAKTDSIQNESREEVDAGKLLERARISVELEGFLSQQAEFFESVARDNLEHDLRNPLAAVVMGLELLTLELEQSSSTSTASIRLLHVIQNNTVLMGRLLDKIEG
jgi:signal transduction histidine kinase